MKKHCPAHLIKRARLVIQVSWVIFIGLSSCLFPPPLSGISIQTVDPQGQPYQVWVGVIDSLRQQDSLIFKQTIYTSQTGQQPVFIPHCRAGYYRVIAQCERTQTISQRVVRHLGKLTTFAIVIPQRQYWIEH